MSTVPATEAEFNRLLDAMPRIAEVVNAFTSEEVQRRAFDALVRALGINGAHSAESEMPLEDPPNGEAPPPADHDVKAAAKSDASPRNSRTRTKSKRSYTIPKGLNFAPEGQPSLEDFAREKSPRNMDERNLLACYYLSQMMGIGAVDVGHVLAVYQAAPGWTASSNPESSLQLTASKLGWLDTSDMKTIKVVWNGENHIKSKMPVKQDKKKAA